MHTIFNAFVVLCGLILVVLAYNMKRKEVSYLREKAITDENSKEKEEKTQEIKRNNGRKACCFFKNTSGCWKYSASQRLLACTKSKRDKDSE